MPSPGTSGASKGSECCRRSYLHACMYASIHLSIDLYTCSYLYAYVYMPSPGTSGASRDSECCLCRHVQVCMYICMYVSIHLCIDQNLYQNLYIYMYTYPHLVHRVRAWAVNVVVVNSLSHVRGDDQVLREDAQTNNNTGEGGNSGRGGGDQVLREYLKRNKNTGEGGISGRGGVIKS